MAKVRTNTDNINTFWRTKRSAAEMDAVYAGLLRSGKSSQKRHYELTGPMSDAEAAQSPEAARMQRLLALPPTEEEKTAVAAVAKSGAAGGKAAAAAAAAAK
jgi:hypothetical protein